MYDLRVSCRPGETRRRDIADWPAGAVLERTQSRVQIVEAGRVLTTECQLEFVLLEGLRSANNADNKHYSLPGANRAAGSPLPQLS